MKRRLCSILVLGLLVFSSLAHAGGDFAAFEGLGEWVLRNESTTLVSRVTGVAGDEVADSTWRSFLQRMRWQQSRALSDELAQNLRQIESDFAAFRAKEGKSPTLAEGERLSPEELDFLKKASSSLKTDRIDNLVEESIRVYDPASGARADGPGTLARNRQALVGAPREAAPAAPAADSPDAKIESLMEGRAEAPAAGRAQAVPHAAAPVEAAPKIAEDVPELPIPRGVNPESIPNLSDLKLRWYQKIAIQFRAYRGFFRSFRLAEGDWKTLLGFKGKAFTPNDLAIIRKYNRLLDGLNDYAQMRLVMRSFANERPVLYTKLNDATADATAKYLSGELTAEKYLAARVEAAKALELNDVVGEAEKRMLAAVERCAELGGGRLAGREGEGLIAPVEANVRAFQTNVARAVKAIQGEKAELTRLQSQLSGAADRAAAQAKIDDLQRELLEDTADRDLWKSRLDGETKLLEGYYADFATNYDQLELWMNMRAGRINSEVVQPFDLPDAFVPSQAQMRGWKDLSDNALVDASNQLVIGEAKLFIQTQAGRTRSFVRKLNDMTGKYFGQKFTDSQAGQGFKDYSDRAAVAFLKRAGAVVGISVPPTLGVKYADKVWNWFFADDKKTAAPAKPDSSAKPDLSAKPDPAGDDDEDPSGTQ